jgi:hypothetical protein
LDWEYFYSSIKGHTAYFEENALQIKTEIKLNEGIKKCIILIIGQINNLFNKTKSFACFVHLFILFDN